MNEEFVIRHIGQDKKTKKRNQYNIAANSYYIQEKRVTMKCSRLYIWFVSVLILINIKEQKQSDSNNISIFN